MQEIIGLLPAIMITFGAIICAIGAFKQESKRSGTTVLIMCGALLSIIGGFWSAINQAQAEKEYSARLESILSAMTGGDVEPQILAFIHDGNIEFILLNNGDFTLFDLDLRLRVLKGEHAFMISPKEAFEGAQEEVFSLSSLVPARAVTWELETS